MKPFEQLAISSQLPFAIVAEFVTWCMRSRLQKESESEHPKVKISSRRHGCVLLLEQVGAGAFELTVSQSGDQIEKMDDVHRVIRAALGIHVIGGGAKAEGKLSHAFPDQKFLDKACPAEKQISSLDKPINSQTCLTLADLHEIYDLLIDQPADVSDLCREPKFLRVFPSIDYYQGCYGFPRHRSGNYVLIDWVDQKYAESHGIDGPNPSDHLYEKYIKEQGWDDPDDQGFAGYERKRWKLAKTLGQVPDEFKSGVFDWVAKVAMDVEEFHSTRGGFPIPETFEYFYGDSVIYADRQLDFEIIDCSKRG
jgi:hypothetical protein